MLCENCQRNQASVHTVGIVNGVKQEHYLCAECAQSVQGGLPAIMEILLGLELQQPKHEPEHACACGTSFAHFRKTGLLGCPQCYATFESELLPTIKHAQGGRTHHVGRRPYSLEETNGSETPAAQEETAGAQCARLREELQTAVKQERYERAAELRDRLRAMEGGEHA